jgi:hypothetical protein
MTIITIIILKWLITVNRPYINKCNLTRKLSADYLKNTSCVRNSNMPNDYIKHYNLSVSPFFRKAKG